MKDFAKRLLSVLLVCSMLFAFAACRDDGDEAQSTTAQDAAQADAPTMGDAGEETQSDVDPSSDSTNPDQTHTDASGNIVTTLASSGGAQQSAASKPSTNAEILAAYTVVMDNAKRLKPGFTKSEWQVLPSDKRNFGGVANTVIGLANLFMMSESDAKGDKKEIRQKGYNMEWFPIYKHSTKGCLLTDTSKIKSAKCEVLSNGNYRITIVLKDDTNPEPYLPAEGSSPNANGSVSKGFVGQMFNPLAKSDIDNTLINDNRVNKVVKDAQYSLRYYDCTAVLVYNPSNNRIVTLNQYMHVFISANAKILGMPLDGDAVLDNYMEIYDLKY